MVRRKTVADYLIEPQPIMDEAASYLGLDNPDADPPPLPPGPPVNGRHKPLTVEEQIRAQLATVEKCSHDELLAAELPPLRWIVSGIIPDEGLTFLGGKKKLGKSWLCLQIAQAVSLGAFCLEKETSQGPVVYVCLEDGKRRVKSRLEKQSAPGALPITYYTRFPHLDGDGTGVLLEMLDEARPRLVIIDTLAAAKTGKVDENAAGPLADIANFLRGAAQHFSCGILVTHHHGKNVIGDPGSDLRGTSALGGAGDVNLGLYREEGQFLLRGEGRDIQEFSLGLKFDPVDTWCWQVGEERRTPQQDAEFETMQAVHSLGGQVTASGIAELLGLTLEGARQRLQKLVKQKHLIVAEIPTGKTGRPGIIYRLVEEEE
jgi:hypothetical protein